MMEDYKQGSSFLYGTLLYIYLALALPSPVPLPCLGSRSALLSHDTLVLYHQDHGLSGLARGVPVDGSGGRR